MEFEDAITTSSLERMKSKPLTKIIIISKDHQHRLALIKNTFPELKDWTYNLDKEFNHRVFLKNKTQLYIINQFQTPTGQLIEAIASKNNR